MRYVFIGVVVQQSCFLCVVVGGLASKQIRCIPLSKRPGQEPQPLSSLVVEDQEFISQILPVDVSYDEESHAWFIHHNQGLVPYRYLDRDEPAYETAIDLHFTDEWPSYELTPFLFHSNDNCKVVLCDLSVFDRVDINGKPRPRESMSFGELRELVHSKTSPHVFDEIFQRVPADDACIQYAQDNLQRWPNAHCVLPAHVFADNAKQNFDELLTSWMDPAQQEYIEYSFLCRQDPRYTLLKAIKFEADPSKDQLAAVSLNPFLTSLKRLECAVGEIAHGDVSPLQLASFLGFSERALQLEEVVVRGVFMPSFFVVNFLKRNHKLVHLELEGIGSDMDALLDYMLSDDASFHLRCTVFALRQSLYSASSYVARASNGGMTCAGPSGPIDAQLFRVDQAAHTHYGLTFGSVDVLGMERLTQWVQKCTVLESLDLSWLIRSFEALRSFASHPLPSTLKSLKVNSCGDVGDVSFFATCVERWSCSLEELEVAGVKLSPKVCDALSRCDLSGSTLNALGLSVGPTLFTRCDLGWFDVLCQRGLTHLTLYSAHSIDVKHVEHLIKHIAKTSVTHLTCHFMIHARGSARGREASGLRQRQVPVLPVIERHAPQLQYFEHPVVGWVGRGDSSSSSLEYVTYRVCPPQCGDCVELS